MTCRRGVRIGHACRLDDARQFSAVAADEAETGPVDRGSLGRTIAISL